MKYIKKYSYCVWLGAMCDTAGWHPWTWQFFVAAVPMIILVNLRDHNPPNDGAVPRRQTEK
jgi:hypothetical protein